MTYQSRKRGFLNRRERLAQHRRNIKLILLFVLLGLILLAFFRAEQIWAWWSTYFY